MANFNNPNNPHGMMPQHQGFMNSPSSAQMNQQHNSPGPGFGPGSMNQVPTTGTGMQGYQPQQQQSMGFSQISHPSPSSMQHHPKSPLMSSGSRPGSIRSQSPSDTSMNPMHPSTTAVKTFQQQPQQHQQQQKDLNMGPQRPIQQQQQQPQQQQQQKELNAASLCRFGQETVQEVVSRTQELFQTLRAAQPPDGKQMGIDRKHKFQETLKGLRILFKRLRVIYEKMEEAFPSSEDTYFEDSIPVEGNEITVLDDKKNTEAYRIAAEEYRDIVEQVVFRNRHLKETVDHLRQIIWDINTMLMMRKE